MTIKPFSFEVRGSGEFPLDMLRYDRCWPTRGEDVDALEPSYGNHRLVRLSCHREASRGGKPTQDVATKRRWCSFGWEVVATSK